MVKVYLYTENDVLSYSSSKVIAWTDTQTRLKLLTIRIREWDTTQNFSLYKVSDRPKGVPLYLYWMYSEEFNTCTVKALEFCGIRLKMNEKIH